MNTKVAKFLSGLSQQQSYWHQNTGYVPITTAAYKLSKQGFYQTNPGTDTAIKQLSLNILHLHQKVLDLVILSKYAMS